MGRPGVGNPGNKGNRHATGRPSKKEHEWHFELWQGRKGKKESELLPWDITELETKIASKK